MFSLLFAAAAAAVPDGFYGSDKRHNPPGSFLRILPGLIASKYCIYDCSRFPRRPNCGRHTPVLDCVWNVMVHAQKPDFVFRRNGWVHLNRPGGGASVQSTTGSRGVRISGSNTGYTKFRGSVKSTGYPLHSQVSPSFPLLNVTVCHHVSSGLYKMTGDE